MQVPHCSVSHLTAVFTSSVVARSFAPLRVDVSSVDVTQRDHGLRCWGNCQLSGLHQVDKVGVDFAGPISVKSGPSHKPVLVKSYICVFVSLTVKAVHLETVSDLTTEAFLALLRRFVARRGKPSLILSDHGTNFVGAARELKDLADFLSLQNTQGGISDFCSCQHIAWDFLPEHAPHFGGIWEAAVKSLKTHLRRVTGNIRFTFEELTTLLTQIEACLNSRPLVPLPSDDDGIEVLTPGHFLIARPIESLPDGALSYS